MRCSTPAEEANTKALPVKAFGANSAFFLGQGLKKSPRMDPPSNRASSEPISPMVSYKGVDISNPFPPRQASMSSFRCASKHIGDHMGRINDKVVKCLSHCCTVRTTVW